MEGVSSFKGSTSLITDKKINLVYGLNGTGKSTLSNFLYDPTVSKFNKCSITPIQTDTIFVYNQRFIQDNFFVSDGLKGIFSLSKENKAAEEKITKAEKRIHELNQTLQSKQTSKTGTSQNFTSQRQKAMDKVWKIKTTYTGGDRVLKYCLEGLRGNRDRLFEHLVAVEKPTSEPEKTITKLKDEVEALKGGDAHPQPELPTLDFSASNIESNSIFSKAIVGNEDSVVAKLIENLGNSDWVNQGLAYIPDHLDEQGSPCPFCQENTITQHLADKITDYFDESYQIDIETLEDLKTKYLEAIDKLDSLKTYSEHPFSPEKHSVITQKYQLCTSVLGKNKNLIEEKLKSPKTVLKLEDSVPVFASFNEEVSAINSQIHAYNTKLANKESTLKSLKTEFWRILRWQYDQTISRFKEDLNETNNKLAEIDEELKGIDSDIGVQKSIISEAQRETVNIEEAVNSINYGLIDLGIEDFSIVKHTESLYRIVRTGESTDAFHTLSEGEKMMISFLYFCELCKGRASADDTNIKRIAIIDDPISSLSHVFIFNVGQLIRSIFFRLDRFSQVFVLTHSLYFFYELTDPNHERRNENQKLFRLLKSASGSRILEMKYEEIQNDYQAYWSVINDTDQPPALIANCMRNIVEYFFNFVRRRDLNNVFQMTELQDGKYQAFCRYVNRESHSLGQNIIDMKEFDYDVFREGLRLVFKETGYEDHYDEMSKC